MIIVFGSINMDMTLKTPRFPAAEETVISTSYTLSPGGKGANQSLAAARAGAKVALIGRIGDDAAGTRILNTLRRNGVNTSGVTQTELPTGCAILVHDESGEKRTVIASGANSLISEEQVPGEILNKSALVLLQMEIPPEQNWKMLERAKKRGAQTMLNLSHDIHIPKDMFPLLDTMIVNQLQVRQIAKKLGMSADDNLPVIAKAMARLGNFTCIVTLGSKGTLALTPEGDMWEVEALPIPEEVDHTGADDCYCGTLAACLQANMDLPTALRHASAAASLSCMKIGAQDSYPYLGDIEEAVKKIPEGRKVG